MTNPLEQRARDVLAATPWPDDVASPLVRIDVAIAAMITFSDQRVKEALAAAGWQDIETAPKDTWVLVYMPGDDGHMGRIHAARHNTIANGFLWVIGHHFVHDLHPPSHWQPLPAPPPFDTGSCTTLDGAV